MSRGQGEAASLTLFFLANLLRLTFCIFFELSNLRNLNLGAKSSSNHRCHKNRNRLLRKRSSWKAGSSFLIYLHVNFGSYWKVTRKQVHWMVSMEAFTEDAVNWLKWRRKNYSIRGIEESFIPSYTLRSTVTDNAQYRYASNIHARNTAS